MRSNPYESPTTVSGNANAIRPKNVRKELAIILLSGLSFFGLGSLGAGLLSYLCVGELLVGERAIALAYWFGWGGRIIGRFIGDLLAGVLVGRHLRLIKPHYVVIAFTLVPIFVIAINRGFVQADGGRWVKSIGYGGWVFQLAVQVFMMWLVLTAGTWFGKTIANHTERSRNAA